MKEKKVSAYAKSLISYCQENHSDSTPMVWTIDNYKLLAEQLKEVDENWDNCEGDEKAKDKAFKKMCAMAARALATSGKITISGIIRGLYDLHRFNKSGEIIYLWTKLTGRERTPETLKALLGCSGKLWEELECGKEYKWQLGFKTYVWEENESKDRSKRKVVVLHKGIPANIEELDDKWKKEHSVVNWVDTKDVEKGQPCRRKEYLIGYRTILRPASAERIIYYLYKHQDLENVVAVEKANAESKAVSEVAKAAKKAEKVA